MDLKKVFKHGVMQSLVLSEIHRGNYGSTLYACCVRYDKRIFRAYPTMGAEGPIFKVEVRLKDGKLKRFSFPYHQFKKAAEIFKQYALMQKGRGQSYTEETSCCFESVG